MVFSGTTHILRLARAFSWPAVTAFVLILPVSAQAQSPAPGNSEQEPTTPTAPNILRPSSPNPDPKSILRPTVQESNVLSLQGGRRLMSEAEKAIAAQDYAVAAKKLSDSRQVFNQLSSYYQELTSSFLGIDNKASDSLRKKALEAAQMRDQATYQLALVHRAQNQPSLAVPLLIEIIRSQQPTRDLGQKSYQQLLEMGFVDVPYRGLKSSQSTSSQPAQPPNESAP